MLEGDMGDGREVRIGDADYEIRGCGWLALGCGSSGVLAVTAIGLEACVGCM